MVKNITKDHISNVVSSKAGISKSQSNDIVNDIVDIIKETVILQGKLRITHFGTFTLHHKNERIGRNPKTKKQYNIPSRKLISFKASDVFKDYVNNN